MRTWQAGALGAVILAASVGHPAAGPDEVALPADHQATFVNYLDVDHIARKRVRRMYVNPAAHDSAVSGGDLPNGTVVIMEDHDAEVDADGALVRDEDGRLSPLEAVTNVFVMEKNAAWSTANGNWDYAWYLTDGSPRPDANFDGCFACHANRAERDFTFTLWTYVADLASRQ